MNRNGSLGSERAKRRLLTVACILRSASATSPAVVCSPTG